MKPLHIFRSGTHITMGGDSLNFSESDLAATVKAYDPALHEAPLVFGHPKHDSPAGGWVKSLSFADHGLVAETQQVDANFAEQIAKGSYKKISASFYHPDAANNPVPGVYYLRHVGFLGGQPPSVKGLRPIELAEDEEGVVEFGDFGNSVSAGIFRKLREWLIGQFGQTVADQVVPNWEVETLAAESRREDVPTAFSDPATKPTTEVTAVTEAEAAAIKDENERLRGQIDKRQKDDLKTKQETTHAKNVEYAEQLVTAGMKPVHVDAIVAALDFAEGGAKPVEFGEGDEREPLSEGLKKVFNTLAGSVSFSEQASKERAGKISKQSANPLLADAEARNQK
ncbi:peptidase [Pseudomonas sp. WS 5079]|uniref:peptidase n=1 Tax=Pseudomonas sp. WS 5079 TaxID=2717492 RepID=UPI001556521A|nr:peptidase [Pseudomonas sp. WS 5079]NMX60204.1 peptidase [Pseudomonas sp. WS 5079]